MFQKGEGMFSIKESHLNAIASFIVMVGIFWFILIISPKESKPRNIEQFKAPKRDSSLGPEVMHVDEPQPPNRIPRDNPPASPPDQKSSPTPEDKSTRRTTLKIRTISRKRSEISAPTPTIKVGSMIDVQTRSFITGYIGGGGIRVGSGTGPGDGVQPSGNENIDIRIEIADPGVIVEPSEKGYASLVRLEHDMSDYQIYDNTIKKLISKFNKDFPNLNYQFYAQRLAKLRITEQTLKNLRLKNVPDDVLDKLQSLENQEFTRKERFLDSLKRAIGDEQTVRFESLILKHALSNSINANILFMTGEDPSKAKNSLPQGLDKLNTSFLVDQGGNLTNEGKALESYISRGGILLFIYATPFGGNGEFSQIVREQLTTIFGNGWKPIPELSPIEGIKYNSARFNIFFSDEDLLSENVFDKYRKLLETVLLISVIRAE